MSLWEQEEQVYREFAPVTLDAERHFAPFYERNLFGDTTFSLMYAWEDRFRYAWRRWERTMAVLEHGMEDRLSCIVLWEDPEEFCQVVQWLYDRFHRAELPLYFEHVQQRDLPLFLRAAGRIGEGVTVRSVWDNRDYIYDAEDFLSLEGKRNRGKRGDVNSLLRRFPGLRVERQGEAGRDLREDCLQIFDQWCGRHACRQCIYGCERKAFARFLEIPDHSRYCLAASYDGNEPLSFAACERIGEDLDCYHFQKNAWPIRGLTYWLNREMALGRPEAQYINLAEDMGLPGLRQDKKSLHPCRMASKFTVQFL